MADKDNNIGPERFREDGTPYPEKFRADGTPYVERRSRKPDPLTYIIQATSILAWISTFIIVVLMAYAKPSDGQNIFAVLLNFTPTPTPTDFFKLRIAFVLLLFTIIMCIVGIISNAMRHKRKTDKYRASLFVFLGIGITLMVLLFVLFGSPFSR